MPGEIMLVPAGPEITAREHDGRQFKLSDAGAVAAASNALVPIVIDYEHQSIHASKNGQPAPAAGWIKKIFVRDGAIFGEVEWTERAAAMLCAKEYRFLSPVLRVNKKTGEIDLVQGAALVADPALSMPALLAATGSKEDNMNDTDETREDAGTQTLRADLIQLLGLAEDAADDAILQAVVDLQDAQMAAAKAPGKEGDTQAAATSQMKAISERLDKLDNTQLATQANAAVDAAIACGKLTPAQRTWATAYAQKDLPGFEKFVANQPVMLAAGDTLRTAVPGDPSGLSAQEMQVCTAMGITPEAFRKHNPLENQA